MKMKLRLFLVLMIGFLFTGTKAFSQDQNFWIYLCFGQSNMEGNATIQAQDMTVNSRFQVLETTDCSNLGRIKGRWYTAIPPLCRCYTGLCPADYFGRTMVANLPANIRVGVVNVSVAGCAIELYDKNNYQTYAATAPSWMVSIINAYGGNPYQYLVDMAKLAQKDGVIKGILLHQGESNVGDAGWPSKIKAIYNNLLADLALKADSIPLLAGELVNADQNGACASMNPIIDKLPQTLSNSYVISSAGCTDTTDNLHFNAAGYRELGKRYGLKMLSLLGFGPSMYYEPECATIGKNWDIIADAGASNKFYVSAKSGFQSTSKAPADSASAIYFPFTVNIDSTYYLYARVNCPSDSNDAYWVKMDNGQFEKCDWLTTTGWQWLKLNLYFLAKGPHTLTIALCENGARLDKICLTSTDAVPAGMGDDAKNLCSASPTTGVFNTERGIDGYALLDNFPNPFNPSTTITFTIPEQSYVTLKVYNASGQEVSTLVSEKMIPGTYSRLWNAGGQSSGTYFARLHAGSYVETKKLVLLK